MDELSSPMMTLLRQEILKHGGVISFHRFMALALYHPEHGYYMSGRVRVGQGGDFVTAPELTSLFGELLTLQCIEIWQRLGAPDRFEVVEMGGGSGRLALDLLTTARRFPDFFAALALRMVETSPDFTQRQQHRLHEAGFGPDRVTWLTQLPARVEQGVILGNEFLDALPVHCVERTAEGWRELGVGLAEGGRLETVPMPAGVSFVAARGLPPEAELPLGYRAEIGVDAGNWMAALGQVLGRGVVLMIDYGEVGRDHFSPRRAAGTLVGHRNGERIDDPLSWPGEMDLTAHVDFSAMARAGVEGGLEVLGLTTQGWFLMGLGILERVEMLSRRLEPAAVEGLRQVIMRLLLPDEMGERFKVLAMGRGVDAGVLSGFRLNDQRHRL
ncbi:MAG: SAM-dependent methyltransferase [Magnetococcales bacterium]|nr:SAM-dependent methyltransferase [Magnetococcales bacterium]